MQQLEKRFYSRQEIADTLGVNIKDSGHFKRNVESKLQKWGYSYNYTSTGITITRQPETPQERLQEILIRKLGIDIQINPVAFACFICAFTDIEGFESMPWEEREKALLRQYGCSVCDKTLRNWCSKLIQCGYISKSDRATYWQTVVDNGCKYRTPVEQGDSNMAVYFRRRYELIQELTKEELSNGKPLWEAKRQAWKVGVSILWKEFGCCYYTCKGFMLNGVDIQNDGCLYEIYELTQEILLDNSVFIPRKIKNKEDFDANY